MALEIFGSTAAEWVLGIGRCLVQNRYRLAKRRRALLESNPPRNNQLESHRSDERAGRGCKVAPFPYYIISIHLPMPQKTHAWLVLNLRVLKVPLQSYRFASIRPQALSSPAPGGASHGCRIRNRL
jgi:hypothetical protein